MASWIKHLSSFLWYSKIAIRIFDSQYKMKFVPNSLKTAYANFCNLKLHEMDLHNYSVILLSKLLKWSIIAKVNGIILLCHMKILKLQVKTSLSLISVELVTHVLTVTPPWLLICLTIQPFFNTFFEWLFSQTLTINNNNCYRPDLVNSHFIVKHFWKLHAGRGYISKQEMQM